jgi:tRNA(Ile)-lysidine synthase
MLSEFQKYIEDNHLAGSNDRVLLAVSGGIDSMVMADLFKRAGFSTAIAHCNFTLRGDESDKDEYLVKSYAAECKVPFYSARFATGEYAVKKGISIEMAARELRYEWFENTRKKFRFDRVAVAHNLNDNIETLLMNLIRGTGIAGLTGMRPMADRIIRPLLFVPRQAILEYAMKHKISYREDKSNADTKFTRNKIRHLILPVLKQINPSIEATLNETAGRFSELNEILTSCTANLRKTLFSEREGHIIFSLSQPESGIRNKTILYELLKPYGISGSNLDDMINIIEGRTGSQLFTGTYRLVKNRKEIVISPESQAASTIYNVNSITELIKVPGIVSARHTRVTEKSSIPSDPCIACLDAGKITFPLIIRKWKRGDYFYPLGMNHKKKLSDYFVDRKLSRPDKEKIQVAVSSGMIVWIIGERIDNRFRITDSTRKALIIKARS